MLFSGNQHHLCKRGVCVLLNNRVKFPCHHKHVTHTQDTIHGASVPNLQNKMPFEQKAHSMHSELLSDMDGIDIFGLLAKRVRYNRINVTKMTTATSRCKWRLHRIRQ